MKKQTTLPKLKAKAQTVFNEYIRKRDEGKPCIACGQHKTLQAGHFYSVRGYDGLRYDEDNVAGECAGCNCFDDMHLLSYAINLQNRIGEHGYNQLQIRATEYKMYGKKWTRSELLEIIETYQQKLKNLN